MAKYHFLVAGAGLFGSVFAQRAAERGKRCLVLERRKVLGGNLHCDEIEGIHVPRYGPHVFHTNDREVWEYVNRFARFNNFIYAPITSIQEGMFETPFNMNTYTRLWEDVRTPEDARRRLRDQIGWEEIGEPQNLEEQCLRQYGRDLYEKLLQGYLEKQWGKPCRELPPNAARLQPPRYTFDNRYYTDAWQGVPIEGYDVMIKRMLAGCDVMLGTDYMPFRRVNPGIAEKVIFTGMIDEYFNYKQGMLQYRTMTYENEVLDMPDYQGTAVVRHPKPAVPYTRTIEHKHFYFGNQPKTVVTKEIPAVWSTSREPCFPIHDKKNQLIYRAYCTLAVAQPDVTFCGRLGSFRFYQMDETVRAALDLADKMIQ